MEEDIVVNAYFSDNARFADLINGLVFGGRQVVRGEELEERDSQTGIWQIWDQAGGGKKRYRDLLRRAPFGVSFAIMGLESQKEVHYLMPLRTMDYDLGEYQKQAKFIAKKVKKQKGNSRAEYLSGFRKTDRLQPCITLVLYYGDDWDGSRKLKELFDLACIPKELRPLIHSYPINLVEIRKMENTDVFRTDIKVVFDFIRCSGDKEKLEELVKGNPAYQEMEDDAYMVAVKYSNNKEILGIKNDYKVEKGRKRNLCKAILDMIEEGREEGREEARKEMREEKIQIISQMIKEDMDKALIWRITKCTEEEYAKASLYNKQK